MDARKETGRSALPTPTTALSKIRDPKNIPDTTNAQLSDGRKRTAGSLLRCAREIVARLHDRGEQADIESLLDRAGVSINSLRGLK